MNNSNFREGLHLCKRTDSLHSIIEKFAYIRVKYLFTYIYIYLHPQTNGYTYEAAKVVYEEASKGLSDAFKKLSEARSNHGLSPATLWRSRTYRF